VMVTDTVIKLIITSAMEMSIEVGCTLLDILS
jgi:hypothetical protein